MAIHIDGAPIPQVYIIVSANVIAIIACCCLLYGAIKYYGTVEDKWNAVLAYLVATVIEISLRFIAAIVFFTIGALIDLGHFNGFSNKMVEDCKRKYGESIFTGLGTGMLVMALLMLCFWFGVLNFFKELRKGSRDSAFSRWSGYGRTYPEI